MCGTERPKHRARSSSLHKVFFFFTSMSQYKYYYHILLTQHQSVQSLLHHCWPLTLTCWPLAHHTVNATGNDSLVSFLHSEGLALASVTPCVSWQQCWGTWSLALWSVLLKLSRSCWPPLCWCVAVWWDCGSRTQGPMSWCRKSAASFSPRLSCPFLHH